METALICQGVLIFPTGPKSLRKKMLQLTLARRREILDASKPIGKHLCDTHGWAWRCDSRNQQSGKDRGGQIATQKLRQPTDVEVTQRVSRRALDEAVKRASILSYVLAIAFGTYGLTSTEFIAKFLPEVSVWANTWPRLLFNCLPLVLLGWFLKASQMSSGRKLLFWTRPLFDHFSRCSLDLCVADCAARTPEIIITYVNEANLFLIGAVFAGIAPPKKFLFVFVGVLSGIFVLPLFWWYGEQVIRLFLDLL